MEKWMEEFWGNKGMENMTIPELEGYKEAMIEKSKDTNDLHQSILGFKIEAVNQIISIRKKYEGT